MPYNIQTVFPDPRTCTHPEGLVAWSHALTPALILDAYHQGIFPWSEHPVRWYSPNPRAVFTWPHIHIPSNLNKLCRKQRLKVSFNHAFTDVMKKCAETHAHEGCWISEGFIQHYTTLHTQGYAHSVEVWQDGVLVGGIYGVLLGRYFSGESMFHTVSNASKVAFATLARKLQSLQVQLFDAQVLNPHTQWLGAVNISRTDYLNQLTQALEGSEQPLPHAVWQTSPF
jgi:leucyl/phenylalanyl-tRNA--protein transferase